MNPFTQSVISSAIVSAVLWAACATNAARAAVAPAIAAPPVVTPAKGNAPPNFDRSQSNGALITQGENNVSAWRDNLTGYLANYNAFTEKQNQNEQVGKILATCRNKKGQKSADCDFRQKGSGSAVNVTSLLGVLGYPSDDARNAAIEFVMRATNNSPYPYPGDAKVYKNPMKTELTKEGLEYFSTIFKQLPGLTIPQFVMAALLADRERLPGLGGSSPVGDGKGSASVMEMLQYEADRRYATPEWFAGMSSATDQAVVREIAYELAFQNYMMVKKYEQDERTQLLLLAMLNALNDMNQKAAQQGSPETMKQYQKKADQAG